jgi:nicotinamidase-related amidase
MDFDPASTAVVIVVMQNGFCHPDGSLYAPPSEEAIEPCRELLDRARDAGAHVVFTRDVHPPDQFEDAHYYDEFDRWGEHVVEGSWEAELAGDLSPRDEELVVVKHTYNAFYQTQLEGWLDAHGVTDLVFAGTLANVCVLHTASAAGFRDYRPVIVEDALGYLEADDREYAIEHADWLFGERTTLPEVAFE